MKPKTLREILEYLLYQSQGGTYTDSNMNEAEQAIRQHFLDMVPAERKKSVNGGHLWWNDCRDEMRKRIEED